ncbi:MAG: ribonuclease J [Rhodobacter sp.]|uniref:ribonuclease J n=1 Tax=Pararhodobacter sp. TaxID=2127056 RepID=UPI002CB8245F|nr:ribonuclease J [Pararhodobacter sp.]MCC0073860.1 ribonuclease J [Rhodobacter sp.]HPD93713.1 ribonuclease J [Pararhodobacter sp.]
MKADRLIYLPLGGAGEVGMNAYVYGYGPKDRERLILVDVGVTFPDMDGTPGVDLIMADMAWLEQRRDRLDGIFITHAHEDHVGGLGHLWSRLRAPVYARDFTARIAAKKMLEAGQPVDRITTVAKGEVVELGPFQIEFLPVSHSLPEASAMLIGTPAGRVLHTGDFKLDIAPGVGEPFDEDLFRALGDKGVHVMVSDSTNIFSPHPGRSESSLPPAITELVRNAPGLVVATTFASNVARVRTLAKAARAAGRSVCLLGRAMQTMVRTATEARLLHDFPPVVSAEEANELPRQNLMLIVTGSQGERRAASAQLARGSYLGFSLKEGDTFLFSSMTIPGNERDVLRIVNALSEQGVDIADNTQGQFHVSGHANRPDLERMHDLVRPEILIPMHGEHRHLRQHALLAQRRGMASAIAPNGTMLDLTGPEPVVAGHVDTGRLYLDGTAIYGAMDGVVRERIKMALNGLVMVTLVIDEDGMPLGDAWADCLGLSREGRSNRPLNEVIEDELSEELERTGRKVLASDDKLIETIRRRVRACCLDEIGKKPEVQVVVSRLSDA